MGTLAKVKSEITEMTMKEVSAFVPEIGFKQYPTGLSEYNSLFLTSAETLTLDGGIPGCSHWPTLKNPTKSENDVRQNQNDNTPLKRTGHFFVYSNAE